MIGFFDDSGSLRDAVLAVEAKRHDDWDRLSWALLWVVNRMPSFSKRRRSISLSQLNPYRREEYRRQVAAQRDAGFDALWAIAEEK